MAISATAAAHLGPALPSLGLLDCQAVDATCVAIAHGQRLMRAGLRTLLERETDIVVVEAATGDDAVDLSRRVRPDVVLVDVEIPGLDCVETTRRIVAGSVARVMVLTTSAADPRVFATLVAGAAGLVLEDREPAVLVRAVRRLGPGWRPRRRPRARRSAGTPMPAHRVIDITHRRGEN
jgi:DNA-binding NarL/FixJ family response regulator